jgi:hypothetical protein
MAKPAFLILCTTALGLLGAAYFFTSADPLEPAKGKKSYTVGEILDITGEAEELDARVAAYQRFHETLERAKRDLLGGSSLRQAAETVYRAAIAHYPKFLEHLRTVELGDSDRERIARNLIGHIETGLDYGEYPPDAAILVCQLQAELDSSLLQTWRAAKVARGKASWLK